MFLTSLSNDWYVIFILVIGALVLAGIIVYLVYNLKQPYETIEETIEQVEHEEMEPEHVEQEQVEIETPEESTEPEKETFITYQKSFMARLIQAPDDAKERYNKLKNYIMSFKGVNNNISWNYDSFLISNRSVVKLKMNGKVITAYLALHNTDGLDTKYKFKYVGDVKTHEQTPIMVKVRGPRELKYLLELVKIMFNQLNIEQGEIEDVDYRVPYEETEALLEKGLVKEILQNQPLEVLLETDK